MYCFLRNLRKLQEYTDVLSAGRSHAAQASGKVSIYHSDWNDGLCKTRGEHGGRQKAPSKLCHLLIL